MPGWIVFPRHAEHAETKLAPLRKGSGFLRLQENCFNYTTLGRTAFDSLGQVIETAECYELPFAQAVAAAELVEGLSQLQSVAGLPLDAA